MAQKSDFKTVETDLDELEEKIRKHRRKIAKRIIIVVAAVVALFLIVWLWRCAPTSHLMSKTAWSRRTRVRCRSWISAER